MNDAQTAEVAVNAVTGMVNMFKDAGILYWIIAVYSTLVGAAMTYVGKRHFKKLIFLVGAFTVYLPMHYFASPEVAIACAVVAGLVMIFMYPVFVFLIGVTVWAIILTACGVKEIGTVTALIGAAFGIVAIIFRKHIVIPVTAWSGAWMLALGLAFLFGGINIVLFVLLGLLFVGSGVFVQYKWTAKTDKRITTTEKGENK